MWIHAFHGSDHGFFPYYYIDLWVKIITALASLGTAYSLWRTYPQIIELPNPFAKIDSINKDLEQFAFVVAHDLKSPLRAISNLSNWLEEDLTGQVDEESNRKINLLKQSAQKMDRLLDGILQYSRIGRGRSNNSEYIPLSNILKEISEILDLQGKKFVAPKNLPSLYGNKAQLSQLFINLIDNAVKHHDKPQGTIEVLWSEDNNYHNIIVKDDGPGIDPRYHKKIFEIFQTLKPQKPTSGIGVGLSIAKKIVTENGGTISVESEIGKGARFIVRWPKRKI